MARKYPPGPIGKRELYERATVLAERGLTVRELGAKTAAAESARQLAAGRTARGQLRLAQLGAAEAIVSGRSVFGQIVKWIFLGMLLLLVIVGPSIGIIMQMTQYLSPTLLFWGGGLAILIFYLRRKD